MSKSAASTMTVEELLALPDDRIDRNLIRGRLRERPPTLHTRRHARTLINLAAVLDIWNERSPAPVGEVLAAGAAFCVQREPATTVGIDVAYVSAEIANQSPDDAYFIEGAPVLAVEILSPSDTHGEVVEQIQLLLESGTAVVWIVDPDAHTVTVYRSQTEPTLFNALQVLSGDPELPGFRVKVADLFVRSR